MTAVAVVWSTTLGNGGVPVPGMDAIDLLPIAPVLVLLLMGGLPLYNLRSAVLDGRALESGTWSLMQVFRWLITLANVVINFVLLALAVFFAAMLITGPSVA